MNKCHFNLAAPLLRPKKTSSGAPPHRIQGTYWETSFPSSADIESSAISAAEFIAQVIGVPIEHITMILNAAPAKDREDLIFRAEALRRCRERTR